MNIELEIKLANYWEHFKFAKELQQSLPNEHPKRISIERELNVLSQELQKLKEYEKTI